MRLGIFGGSFDPVHYGHLLLAESCREQCSLDRVWLLPAAHAPHKQNHRAASARHRVEMLRLALGGHSQIEVSMMEVDRGGVSYTVETLAEIHRQQPDAELFLLMGADTLEDLPHWRAPGRICELAIPVVVRRAGSEEPAYDALAGVAPASRLELFRQFHVTMPILELASSDIRTRVANGQSIRYRTPRAVEKYIETHRLYL
ncbi:MAG: nicotinate (nicotinamide) nucleotide adenylyltransferase [Pirellulaceae bacterium]